MNKSLDEYRREAKRDFIELGEDRFVDQVAYRRWREDLDQQARADGDQAVAELRSQRWTNG